MLTYSHALDLELCHRLLTHGFRSAGLIGSATKRARFRKRLAELGHEAARIDRMGLPDRRPGPRQANPRRDPAIGVAAAFLAGDARGQRLGGGTGLKRTSGDRRRHQGLPGASSPTTRCPSPWARARFTRSWARTARASRRLVKMIYGLVKPDAGAMRLSGKRPTRRRAPTRRGRAGVAMVFQHFSLFDALSVAENVALGNGGAAPRCAPSRRGIREVSEVYGLPLDPRRLVGELSAGERQRVEIVRCSCRSRAS